jgi:hypothetical protein
MPPLSKTVACGATRRGGKPLLALVLVQGYVPWLAERLAGVAPLAFAIGGNLGLHPSATFGSNLGAHK